MHLSSMWGESLSFKTSVEYQPIINVGVYSPSIDCNSLLNVVMICLNEYIFLFYNLIYLFLFYNLINIANLCLLYQFICTISSICVTVSGVLFDHHCNSICIVYLKQYEYRGRAITIMTDPRDSRQELATRSNTVEVSKYICTGTGTRGFFSKITLSI